MHLCEHGHEYRCGGCLSDRALSRRPPSGLRVHPCGTDNLPANTFLVLLSSPQDDDDDNDDMSSALSQSSNATTTCRIDLNVFGD